MVSKSALEQAELMAEIKRQGDDKSARNEMLKQDADCLCSYWQ